MRITPEVVERVARLSRLELTEQEREAFSAQLDSILQYFARLDRLPTEGVEPTSHAIPVTNVFREDTVTPSLPREEVAAMAPESYEGYVVVPRVLEAEA
ncbi:Aspartyl/glutamyl-tRNA(Asn/Gln) amidotransferase subunit C [bacterium HR32]|jgi:aspartyl-tRNA(Asn)/glutamyl-tRNA(Gln) amidotransferase subunit C|nr:Aspartyl/glutamyl-tRNA(Asn/Gln) amidotransferase subunit C [bacterium HR32]